MLSKTAGRTGCLQLYLFFFQNRLLVANTAHQVAHSYADTINVKLLS